MSEKKKTGDVLISENRRARFDYAFDEMLECGIELRGVEVKALRQKLVSFKDSYAVVENGELILRGLGVDRVREASTHEGYNPDRPRRLLASRGEIDKLQKRLQREDLSLIPVKMYFKGPWVKVLLGLGKGKSHEDKRETVKRREADRDMRRALERHR